MHTQTTGTTERKSYPGGVSLQLQVFHEGRHQGDGLGRQRNGEDPKTRMSGKNPQMCNKTPGSIYFIYLTYLMLLFYYYYCLV